MIAGRADVDVDCLLSRFLLSTNFGVLCKTPSVGCIRLCKRLQFGGGRRIRRYEHPFDTHWDIARNAGKPHVWSQPPYSIFLFWLHFESHYPFPYRWELRLEILLLFRGKGWFAVWRKVSNIRLLSLFSTSLFQNDSAMRRAMLPHLLLVLSSTERSYKGASIILSHTANTSGELLSTPSQPRHIQRFFIFELLKDPRYKCKTRGYIWLSIDSSGYRRGIILTVLRRPIISLNKRGFWCWYYPLFSVSRLWREWFAR